MSQAPEPALGCEKCPAKFDHRFLLQRHKRIRHQTFVTAKGPGNVKARIRRTSQGFVCPKCNQAFEDPLTCKYHFPGCNEIQHGPIPVPAPVPATAFSPAPAPALPQAQRLLPVRNPHKTVSSRATRAMVRQLHRRHHTDLEISNHLSISPAAVRSVIQNESADNVDSDDDHIADADGLSDEAFAEFCAPRTADLQGIPFSTKMDENEDLDIRMEDLCVHQVTELDNMAMDESSGDVLGHQLSNSPVLEPRSFLPSPSYSPKPAVSPIRIWHDNMDNDSDSDIQEVEQILIDSDEDLQYPEDDEEIKPDTAASSPSPLHGVTEETVHEVVPVVEQSSRDQDCCRSTQVSPFSPSISAAQGRDSAIAAYPMGRLADPIEASLSSLGVNRQWIVPFFKELGCRTQEDFDALSCMPISDVRNIFFCGLQYRSAGHAAPYLPAIEAALLAHQTRLARRPWEVPIPGQLCHTAVSDFLRGLRRPLSHHLELLYSHGVTGLDELDELCRQRADGGLQLAFHVFVNKGSMNFFEYFVLWEGLYARGACLKPLSARAVAHQSSSIKFKRHEPVESSKPGDPMAPVTPTQIDSPALSNHLASLDPPLSHLFPPLSIFGIRTEDDLRYCLKPEIRGEFCTALMERGMPILDWMSLTHSHGENAPTYPVFFEALNTVSPPISFMANELWNAGIRTMEDIRVLSRFPRHWTGIRERLLAAPGSTNFAHWLTFKRTLRYLTPPAEPLVIDDVMQHFLRGLSRSLIKHSTVFSTIFCLESVEELDALCKVPEQWNDVCYTMLGDGRLVLIDLLAFLGGLEKRAEQLRRL